MASLSRNFDSSEFACPCCGKEKATIELVDSLQTLRNLANMTLGLKHQPIRVVIGSGYRCAAHNKAINGAAESYHLLGKAADVKLFTAANVLLPIPFVVLMALQTDFGDRGIIIYPDTGHVHLDVGHKRYLAYRGDGKKKPFVRADFYAALGECYERQWQNK